MTLIVGIKCRDGVVLGADGAATYTTPLGQMHTIQQPVSKLSIIGECVVLGVSGPVGLGQAYFHDIEERVKAHNDRPPWKNVRDARASLHDVMWKHAKQAWEGAEVVAKTVGPGAAHQAALHASVIAFPLNDSPCLLQFNHQCDPEEATGDLPFLAIGSGQPVADPFLAFIRRVFWPKSTPSVDEAIWAVYWTLDYSIKASPALIGYPIQIAVLRQEGTVKHQGWKAFQLADSGEHEQMVEAIEKELPEMVKIHKTLPADQQNPIP